MSWWGNPFGGVRPPQALEAGLAAVDAGAGHRRRHRAREGLHRGGRRAVSRHATTVDQRTRIVAYEKRDGGSWPRQYPDDIEARIFYALALGQTALPTDKTYANQLKAAAILEAEFARQPDHPGLAHYIIHSFDVPPLAPRALRRGAALRDDRARGAARAPHAVAHLHARRRVAGVDRHQPARRPPRRARTARPPRSCTRSTTRSTPTCRPRRTPRPGARSTRSRRSARGSRRRRRQRRAAAAGYYALAAIPARYALERGAWAEAAALDAARDAVRLCRRGHALRPRPRRGAQRQPRPRAAGRRAAGGAARRAADGEGRVLDRAGRDPAAHRGGVDGAGRGPARPRRWR